MDLCELEASLVYRASSMPVSITTEKPCLRKNKMGPQGHPFTWSWLVVDGFHEGSPKLGCPASVCVLRVECS